MLAITKYASFYLQKIVGAHHFQQNFMWIVREKKKKVVALCKSDKQTCPYNHSHKIFMWVVEKKELWVYMKVTGRQLVTISHIWYKFYVDGGKKNDGPIWKWKTN